jgi:hypothetical protein
MKIFISEDYGQAYYEIEVPKAYELIDWFESITNIEELLSGGCGLIDQLKQWSIKAVNEVCLSGNFVHLSKTEDDSFVRVDNEYFHIQTEENRQLRMLTA